MSQHDYNIANASGSAVRADINNVLAAIVSNNSSSSEPSTKYAYMLWADTTNGILKIRNSANNAWIELLQLDGTLTMEDGAEATPGLAFRDDLNTGIWSSAADTFNISTGGTERLELGAATVFNESGADVDFRIEGDSNANLFYVDAGNDRVGIGKNDPSTALDISGELSLPVNNTIRWLHSDGSVKADLYSNSGGTLIMRNTAQSLSLDSSGNLTITGDLVLADTKGIDFSATANGGTGTPSETLTDYEQGSWTPTYEVSGSGIFAADGTNPITYTYQTGKNTRIGNKVFATYYLRASGNVSTNANEIKVGGLPITSNSSAQMEGGGFMTYTDGFFGSDAQYYTAVIWVPNSSAYFTFYRRIASGAITGNDVTPLAKYIIGQIIYTV